MTRWPASADGHSADRLAACLADPDPAVRAAAVRTLATDPPDLDGLVRALHDPAYRVRHVAGEALAAQRTLPAGVVPLLHVADVGGPGRRSRGDGRAWARGP